MSGPTYPGGYPTNPGDPNSQPGYPSFPQQPPAYEPPAQQPYSQPYQQRSAQPPQKRSRGWLVLAIVAVVLLVACVGLCSALGIGAKIAGDNILSKATQAATQFSQVETQVATQARGVETQLPSVQALLTVSEFCEAESSRDYSTAYSQLSSSLKQQYSQAQFTEDGQHHDSTLGTISECSPAGGVTVKGSTATTSIMVTRTPTSSSGTPNASQTSTATGQITLVQSSNGNWAISSVSSALNML